MSDQVDTKTPGHRIGLSDLLIASALAASLAACTRLSPRSTEPRPTTEIVLVGALHWQHLYTPGYTFAHLRALLDRIRPDVIGVERPGDWRPVPGRTEANENSVTVPYAIQRALPIHGIDWVDFTPSNAPCFWPVDEPDTAQMQQRFQQQVGVHRATAAWYAALHFEEVPWGIDSMSIDPWPDSLAFLDSLREDRIARNILELASRYPGKRLLVVLGGLHLHTQPRRLQGVPGVRLVDPRSFLPLREAEVQAAWHAEDVYPLLGATIDSWVVHGFPEVFNHGRSRELLQRLIRQSPYSTATWYYRARWELMLGRYDAAAAILDSLLSERSTEVIPFYEPASDWSWPPWSQAREKALFTRAILFDLQGRHVEAVGLYERLLRELTPEQLQPPTRSARGYYDMAAYLRSLIRQAYRGGPWEAVRIQDNRRCRPVG